MFVETGSTDISVRQVAARAGVNHGLVHRHFGTKRELLGAVLGHLAQRLADASVGDLDDLGGIFRALQPSPYWRLLSHLLVEGDLTPEMQSSFPTMKVLIESFRRGQEEGRIDPALDPRIVAAGSAALGLGWMFFEPFLLPASGLDDEPIEEVREQYQGLLAELLVRLAPREGLPKAAAKKRAKSRTRTSASS